MTADAGVSYPVKFKNFLKTTFSQNTSGGLLQLDLGLVKVPCLLNCTLENQDHQTPKFLKKKYSENSKQIP